MVYDLAKWFQRKSLEFWRAWLRRGFFGKIFFSPYILLCLLCFLISLVLFAASFMTILENVVRGLFFFFKRKIAYAGLFGKVFYLPFFLGSVFLCVCVIVLSIGGAFPFRER